MREIFAVWWLVPGRFRAGWRLLTVAGVGVVLAAALLAASPTYARAMAELGLQFRLGRALEADDLHSVAVQGLLGSPSGDATREGLERLFKARLGAWVPEATTAERSTRVTLEAEGTRWASFLHVLDLERNAEVTLGRLPDPAAPTPEVVLLEGFERHVPLGGTLSIDGGSFDDCERRPASEIEEERRAEVPCRPTTRVTHRFEATVVGFVRPRDPGAASWTLSSVRFEVPDAPLYASLDGLNPTQRAAALAGEGAMPLLVAREAREALVAAAPLLAYRVAVGGRFDAGRVASGDVERIIEQGAQLQRDVADRLGLSATFALPSLASLQTFRTSLSFNQVPLLLILLQVAGIVLYYVVIVSQMLVEREAEEVAVLGSRGAAAGQLAGLHLVEAVTIAVPAALVAPWLASAGVSLLGLTPAFSTMTGGGLLPASVTPLAFVLAAGGAVLALAAMLVPALVASRSSIVTAKARQARPAERGVLQRYYLDLAVVVLAGVLLWQLQQRGAVFASDSVGGWSSDPLLLLSPFVFAVAVAALVLRFYPPLLRGSAAILGVLRGTAVALGLRRAARAPGAYARLLLLLVLAMAVGTFAASYGPTVAASREDRAHYEAGADFRQGLSGSLALDIEGEAAALREAPGVTDVALAARTTLLDRSGNAFPTLGVDAERTPSVLWFREDFAGESLPTLMRRLQSAVPPGGGIELPFDAYSVEVSVYGVPDATRGLIWVRVRDAMGAYHNLELGRPSHEGWRAMLAEVPPEVPRPVFFQGLLITDERGIGVRNAGAVFFDDLLAIRAGGDRVMVDDFDGQLGWTMFAPANSEEGLALSQDQALSGRVSLQWSWPPGQSSGRRLLAMNPGNVPLSSIVSTEAASRLGVREGDSLALLLEGIRVPLVVRGVVDYFPTLDPASGFIVVRRDDLEALGRLLEVPALARANEIWLDLEGTVTERAAAIEVLRARLGPFALSGPPLDSAAAIEAVRADPTLQASGSGILGGAFAAVLGVWILAFVVTVATDARARATEFAVLRAVGSSRAQALRALILEWGTVLALGLVVGIVLGRRIAGVMLSFLDVTEEGSRVVPPFALQTDWPVVVGGALLLVAAIAIGITVSWLTAMRQADAARLRLTR